MTHGGIDGHSRLVVYLKCSNNNQASTVYSQFLEAVRNYGLPSRFRSDQGRENCQVARHMLEVRGVERRSMLVGNSVHNQRIERFWRDLFRCVVGVYYRLFYFLDQINLLDPLNEYHLFAVHYVYLPRINRSLDEFRGGWNNHSVRTEHNLTPLQLYSAGMVRLRNSGLTAMDYFDSIDSDYGVEEEGLPGSDEQVLVPELHVHLSEAEQTRLQSTVNPLQDSDNYGIELYEQTLEFLRQLVRRQRLE